MSSLTTAAARRERRFPCDCWGRQSDVTEAEHLASELRALNDEIKRDQKAFLHSAKKLNAMDDKLMNTDEVSETGEESDAADEVAGDEEGTVENQGFGLWVRRCQIVDRFVKFV